MIWNGLTSVPAIGFWGALLLGVVLGVAGVWCLRRVRPRVLGMTALGLAILIPVSVGAVPFTFTNGTAADANQVNANFAAVTPLTGFYITSVNGPFVPNLPFDTLVDVLTPSFVAPRALACVVHFDTVEDLTTPSPSGNAAVEAIKQENGTVSFATAQPLNDQLPMGMVRSIDGNTRWTTSQTRLFTVASGSTVQFGCRGAVIGDFTTAARALYCSTAYECF
jgi:hypothetical protein